ncbi:MAG: nucleoside hydrolase [Provencibacterium sp.]|nr:nucleoside hydrolase [Provencibacterium sp.]
MENRQNVYLIDTDIGDDIDDAYAIAAALGHAGEQIIGITTVFKNTDGRARLARKLLSLSPYPDIPVYAGSGNGLRRTYNCAGPFPQWGEELQEAVCGYDRSLGAAQFIVQMARQYGKRLIIIGIAALTNIAQAILEAPEVMADIGGLSIMGGGFFMHCTEWNILCDPEAARIVMKSGIPKKFAGLDVTLQLRMDGRETRQLCSGQTPLQRYLSELTRRWQGGGPELPIHHDYLAVLSAMEGFSQQDTRFMCCLPQRIRVLTEEPVAGMTYNESSANWFGEAPVPNCLVGQKVDRQAVFKELFKDLGLSEG